MKKGQIILVPRAGLCNRMRAISAAASLAKDIESRLHVVWIQDSELFANFHELFDAPSSFSVSNFRKQHRMETNSDKKNQDWYIMQKQQEHTSLD